VSLSANGSLFNKAYLLRGGTDLQALRYPGTAKTLGYSYPKSTVWNGYLYSGYSVNKEDVECTRVPLTSLQIATPGLPSPWQTADIGNVAASGSASYSSGVFTVAGSGSGIGAFGGGDEFRYVQQPASGDCTIVARVAAVQNTGANAKAGVMIRETVNNNSIHATCSVANGKISFIRRSTTGGSSTTTTVNGLNPPYWVRLQRVGNVFTASRSANGSTWTTVGSATINMATATTFGLAVTSQADGTVTTGTLDNVTPTP
jgi:regulation of enolase protein 1 (concanavalin A-like superfamily)